MICVNKNSKKMFLILVIGLIITSGTVMGQQLLRSPCPDQLTIDQTNQTRNTWSGTVHLYSKVLLNGIYLDLIFDRKTESVGVSLNAMISIRFLLK